MTNDEAIKWLSDELMFLERPNVNKGSGLEKKIAVCRMAIDAIREQEERRWIPATERLPDIGRTITMVIRTKNADGGTEKHRTLMTFAATESGKKVTSDDIQTCICWICDHVYYWRTF